jgi:hypothetical protein
MVKQNHDSSFYEECLNALISQEFSEISEHKIFRFYLAAVCYKKDLLIKIYTLKPDGMCTEKATFEANEAYLTFDTFREHRFRQMIKIQSMKLIFDQFYDNAYGF